jgi:hypothetical protein
MYSQAQDSAEVKGLTLHTDPFELRRSLQRSIEALDARDHEVQARGRRLQGLAAAAVVLWLAVLMVLLDHL